MNATEQIVEVDGELLPAVLETAPASVPGLFGTTDPDQVVARAVEVSDVLARVIRDKRLAVQISGKEHVLVEGWTLLGSMLGVFPVTVWSRRLEDGWEARVEARTIDGRIVGAAESECLRSERKWADDYALRSMSQTRATSKALRQPLGFVMQLAGFEATPADEIPDAAPAAAKPRSPVEGAEPTARQRDEILALLRSLEARDPDADWPARCREIAGVPSRMMTATIAALLIDGLQRELTPLLEDGTADDGRAGE